MLLTQQLTLMQLILFATCTGGTMEITIYQFPPVINATEGESVTLNCAMASEGTLPEIGSVHWTRGERNEYKLDDSPFYRDRLENSDSDSFANNRIFIKISDLTEKDSDTYYCRIDLMGEGKKYGNGTTLEVTSRRQEEVIGDSNLRLVLGGALALLGITIMILTIRLIWQNKVILRLKRNHSEANATYAPANLQTTTQVHSNRGSNEAVSLHYAKVNTKQEGKTRRTNMEVHHVEYATIKLSGEKEPERPQNPDPTYAYPCP